MHNSGIFHILDNIVKMYVVSIHGANWKKIHATPRCFLLNQDILLFFKIWSRPIVLHSHLKKTKKKTQKNKTDPHHKPARDAQDAGAALNTLLWESSQGPFIF